MSFSEESMRAPHVVVAALCASFVAGCQENGGPRLGTVVIEVATTGADIDPDGYTVRISGNPSYSQQVGSNAVVRADYILQGKHSVWLDEVAGNCSHASAPVVNVYAVSLAPVTAKFNVACRAYLGSLRVTTTTTGADLDPDGYMVLIQGFSASVNTNGTITLSKVVEGSHPLTLADVAANCAISGSNPRPVTIVAASLTEVALSFTCSAYGQLRVNAVTTGVDLDPNGYVVNVSGPGGNSSDALPVNGTVTLGQRVEGDDEVRITGVAAGCEFGGANPRTVTIVSGGIVEVTFQLACVAATQLAYMRSEGDSPGIYIVKSNGAGVTRLTTDNGSDGEPSWSPDGSKIAFSSDRQSNVDVYVMDSTGSGVVRLTNASARDSDPAWSPAGSRIAFVSERDGNLEIYTMNADGSNQTRLTNISAEDAEPAWSPDGSKIAFRSERDGNSEIYVMNADGSGVTRLTTNAMFDGQPAWSRDGTKLAFTRDVCDYYYYGYCRRNVFVMKADGTTVLQLTSTDGVEPAWSPDGSRIAFVTSLCTYYECTAQLVAMKADGTDVREIVSGAVSRPAWRW